MSIPINRARVFCEGLDHPEGLAVHPDGSIWAGGEAGQIYRIAPDGQQIDQVADTGGFVLGIAFSPGAEWLAVCDLKLGCLWRLDPATGRLEKLADRVDGQPLRVPNHVSFADDGTLYLSDSGNPKQNDGTLLRFDADDPTRGALWHAGPFHFANGTALDPTQRWLYVAVSFLPGVERVAIRDDGSAGARELVATLPDTVPDGLAFDAVGRLYVSCYTPNRIYRIMPDHRSELFIEDMDAHTLCNPTNLAFGGVGLNDLFTSNLGRWHLTHIDADIPGHPLASHRQGQAAAPPPPRSRETV
ncbi:MAG: SMP-30/gluconolactonase/LRE family protein [Phycisphaeraceae bacterium]